MFKSAPYLSVVIPAYNESKRLPLTLVDIDRHLSKEDFSYEILVVNDGSKDDTAAVVEKLSRLVPHLRLASYEPNQGKGYAVKFGMLEARGRYRLLMDADNSTTVDQFSKIQPFLKEGYHVVIGSRDIKGAVVDPPQPFFKRILGNLGNIYIQLLFLPGIWDTQCGFKCFSEEVAEKVFPLSRVKRFGFDPEILYLAKKFGYKIKQVPVHWVNDAASLVTLVGANSYIKVLLDVTKLRFWFWFDVYGLRTGSSKNKPA
ncbi:MAG: glycosyltransferase family 2 protein [Candidatus Colwellbacteria bacterium]|nr:glycosyltransferase family 2 protein [Candidatus Colwellbacteria bacterium]